MLDHLIVQNYRLFKDLNIPKLGQVNLVTGKNNAGKSTLLEVIRIWASRGNSSVVNSILDKRGDWKDGDEEGTYAALFTDHITTYSAPDFKHELDKNIFINDFWIGFDYDHNDEVRALFLKRTEDAEGNGHPTGFEIANFDFIGFKKGDKNYPQDKAIFIPPSADFDNTSLWDKIELTPREDDVKHILRVIIPDLVDLGISKKGAKVRLKNSEIPAPLKNFGEGTNRLLMIALALVSAKDNILLIDEIDLGLHYSVHEQLWELIFQFAKEWNIQVFATTHSHDCLSAFSYVANRDEYKEMGLSLRLQREKDNIIAVDYAPEELEVALTADIETR